MSFVSKVKDIYKSKTIDQTIQQPKTKTDTLLMSLKYARNLFLYI